LTDVAHIHFTEIHFRDTAHIKCNQNPSKDLENNVRDRRIRKSVPALCSLYYRN